jgi:hypothetical protein
MTTISMKLQPESERNKNGGLDVVLKRAPVVDSHLHGEIRRPALE